jgi:hypothetical protein
VVVGFGWVGFPSEEGYIACDLQNEVNLTRALWNAGSKAGDLGYELGQCAGASAQDNDAGQFYAAITGDNLSLCYRTASSTYRRSVMDFGEGSQASGIAQLLSPDGAPWGWSTPLWQTVSSVGAVRASAGSKVYGVVQANKTVKELDSASGALASVLNLATDFFDSLRHKAADFSIIKFRGASGIPFSARLRGLTGNGGNVWSSPIDLTSVGYVSNYTRTVAQWDQGVRGPNESYYLEISESVANSAMSVVYGAETTVDVLDTYQ